jgi:hypothetical protein
VSIKSIKSGYRGISALVGHPNIPTSVDVLVIAGGGGGGQQSGGGGGAGGLLSFSDQAISSATSYSITIGGGGAGSTTTARGSNTITNKMINHLTARSSCSCPDSSKIISAIYLIGPTSASSLRTST